MAEPTGPVAGRDYPADLAELRAWFPSDDACLDYLDWLRWPDGFCCPRCGSTAAGREATGRYGCHGCRKQVSVTSGTILHKIVGDLGPVANVAGEIQRWSYIKC